MSGDERVVEVLRAAFADRCDRCLKPRASDEDWDTIEPGEGVHLCWAEWSSTCDGPEGDLFAHLAAALAEAGIGVLADERERALREAADALTWVRPDTCPCEEPESCCGSIESCDAMRPHSIVVGADWLRARAAQIGEVRP